MKFSRARFGVSVTVGMAAALALAGCGGGGGGGGSSSGPGSQTVTLSGSVVRSDTGGPLVGAFVVVPSNTALNATTNSSGAFSIPNVPSGQVTLQVRSTCVAGGAYTLVGGSQSATVNASSGTAGTLTVDASVVPPVPTGCS